MEILKILDETLDGLVGEIPSRNTIENWVKKCGFDIYQHACECQRGKLYAAIIDESMMIGGEKVLLTLGVPARHHGCPLAHGDVSVLGMSVSTGWSGEKIARELEDISDKVGHKPDYVTSDNVSSMAKGTRLAGTRQHLDISHSLGMFLERVYKRSPDYQEYVKQMGLAKFKHNMKETAYLLPPSQRVISRFLNLFDWVKWSRQMLEIFHSLPENEKDVFSFIPGNASLVEELSEVMECHERIEDICKHQGLSRATVIACSEHVKRTLLKGNCRMIKLGSLVLEYLKKEAALLESEKAVHNNSSDIIESIFGTYKARMSPNKLHGVTPFILFIPVHAKLANKKEADCFNFKERLENVTLKQIDLWAKKKLSTNLVMKRIRKLSRVG